MCGARYACLLLVVVAGLLSSQAFAESPAEHFNRGRKLYQDRDFAAAAVEFKRAYEMKPDYRVLYNLGQVYAEAKEWADALVAFEKYLADGGSKIGKERREAVEDEIESLRTRVATLSVTTTPLGCEVLIDGRVRGTTPLPGGILMSSGQRSIRVRKKGYRSKEESLEVAGGDKPKLRFTLEKLERGVATAAKGSGDARKKTREPAKPRPVPEDSEPDNTALWVSWGATAGLGALSLVFGLFAVSSRSALNNEKDQLTTADALTADRDRALGFGIATDVMLLGTAVSGGLAIYFTVDRFTRDGDRPAPDTSVTLIPYPGGAALRGSF
ncbi:MAG: PEGA domain-containing protein [Myxococcota bacterium]